MAYTTVLTLTAYDNSPVTTFPVESFAFDVEQTLNIGSQSTGAGAGKVTFNPFSITKRVDVSSSKLFMHCCSGTPFETGVLTVTAPNAARPFAVYTMKLVAVKTLGPAGSQHGGPLMETVSFEYGGLQMQTFVPLGDGSYQASPLGGWNRVKNVSDLTNDIIQ